VKAYYEQRAREYDEWYLGTGLFAERDRPGWREEVEELTRVVVALPPARTLDVACGTGFLTRHLRGEITGLDQSGAMLELARERVPEGTFVQGDSLGLPFHDLVFDRVFTGHFYGHLGDDERETFLAEARRVAPELVVVDSALRDDVQPEEWQERVLNDGSRHEVYKRFFTGSGLAVELGGGEVLHDGRWFVAVQVAHAAAPQPD
jgi:ubiquinone/menaquinone biosynthesis C-methylase UbiE